MFKPDKKWIDRLVNFVDDFREENMLSYRENSSRYQNSLDLEDRAYHEFEELDLTEKEKQIIENLLDTRDGTNCEYNSFVYLTGIVDALKFLHYINYPQ